MNEFFGRSYEDTQDKDMDQSKGTNKRTRHRRVTRCLQQGADMKVHKKKPRESGVHPWGTSKVSRNTYVQIHFSPETRRGTKTVCGMPSEGIKRGKYSRVIVDATGQMVLDSTIVTTWAVKLVSNSPLSTDPLAPGVSP
ncbi:hypothetical protein SELMODRAFT_427750 [Selaginella moellendorffii]|uniref:Uncharacterized protein n=1 Tax=Selaginella moellendorffii TaxID=88036 RepID=D8T0L4_SELML|nr:hypothetical protein SELMODRAFT_427750 [Selaginella moellendorffii]